MAIFNSYVSLPEGILYLHFFVVSLKITEATALVASSCGGQVFDERVGFFLVFQGGKCVNISIVGIR